VDCGCYCCVRFRARVWAGSWSRRVPARVVGNAASSWYTREASGVLPQSDDSMRVDGRRDKTSCEDDDSQRELINPNPNPVPDHDISCRAPEDETNANICLEEMIVFKKRYSIVWTVRKVACGVNNLAFPVLCSKTDMSFDITLPFLGPFSTITQIANLSRFGPVSCP
jgi:hypothetical protein